MAFADKYFSKFELYQQFIDHAVGDNLKIIVVIPCINEPQLLRTLDALWFCKRPKCSIEIIVTINNAVNASDKIKQQNLKSLNEGKAWIKNHFEDSFKTFFIYKPDFPNKFAGAGLARKTGMDEALRRFNQINNSNGIIACFDADSVCDDNYFVEIEKHFDSYSKSIGANVYFEHPIVGDEFEALVYKRIAEYELYLRYYKNGLAYAGFPFAFHTIGSSFVIKASTYAKQGGMNRKQAGEDFYFLQKVFPLGNFHEINTTRIIPSPRASDRVPFGTGAAMTKLIANPEEKYLTYNPKCFDDLKSTFILYPRFFKCNKEVYLNILSEMPELIAGFLAKNNFYTELVKINKNSPNIKIFTDRFFQWFNGFKVLKFINYAHEAVYEKVAIYDAAKELLQKKSLINETQQTTKEILHKYRVIDLNF